jgi:Dolichyl-phosphate-mannose-protein mannosyltransferase
VYYLLNVFAALMGDGYPVRRRSRFSVEVQNRRTAKAPDQLARLTVAVLFVGASLRIIQYALGEVLWYDELAIVRNLVEKSVRDLLTAPLDHAQVAPPGFTLIEKAAITALGNNEYALRLFPLLCALASLPLFAEVARRVLPPGAALLAFTLFSLSPTIISFGSQVKQYSTDLAAALLLMELTLRWWERRHRYGAGAVAALLGAAGFAAVWFSHTAVLVLAGLGAALLIECAYRRERSSLWSLLPAAILSGVGMLGAILVALQNLSPSTHAYMQAYWVEGFMPFPPLSGDEATWLWRAFRSFFHRQLRYPIPGVGVLLMVLGAVTLIKRRHWSALVMLAPIGVAFLASAMHRYPVGERVSLFLLPSILLLLTEGVDRVRRVVAARWRPLGAAVVALAVLTSVHTLYAYFPLYPDKDIRDVLAYVQARRQSEDAVYVFYNAGHALAYYGPQYDLLPQEVVIGVCPGSNTRRLFNELDRFRGKPRVWVIISHAVGPFREREAMLGYLDAVGIKRGSIVVGTPRLGSSAYLYDLSDPERLRTTLSETYVPPEREHGIREFPCPPESAKPSAASPLARLERRSPGLKGE